MWLMFIVLIVSWVHGCIGLYFWLRMKAFFKTAAPFLLAVAVLSPTLAMLGLYQGRRNVADNHCPEMRAWELYPSNSSPRGEHRPLRDHCGAVLLDPLHPP